MKEPNNCPSCGVTWIGEPIPEKDREFFGGSTHFRREIGVEGSYDCIDHYECPDCKATFDRSYQPLAADADHQTQIAQVRYALELLQGLLPFDKPTEDVEVLHMVTQADDWRGGYIVGRESAGGRITQLIQAQQTRLDELSKGVGK